MYHLYEFYWCIRYMQKILSVKKKKYYEESLFFLLCQEEEHFPWRHVVMNCNHLKITSGIKEHFSLELCFTNICQSLTQSYKARHLHKASFF